MSLKGKGSVRTYWLLGEDFREDRNHLVARSSLKNRGIPGRPIARCASFESPKKLRFASQDVEIQRQDSRTEEDTVEPDVSFHTSSTSCPSGIEKLATQAAAIVQLIDGQGDFLSVPLLCEGKGQQSNENPEQDRTPLLTHPFSCPTTA